MAWSGLSKLLSLLTTNVFNTGYTPTGPDVGAEVVRILLRVDQIIDEGVTTEGDVATNTSAIQVLDNRLDADETDITANSNAIALNAADIDTLQTDVAALDAIYVQAFLQITLSKTLTITEYRRYHAVVYSGSGTVIVNPPDPNTYDANDILSSIPYPHPLVIVNSGTGTVQVGAAISQTGFYWATGDSCVEDVNYVELSQGESCTIYPVQDPTSQESFRWAIVAGVTTLTSAP